MKRRHLSETAKRAIARRETARAAAEGWLILQPDGTLVPRQIPDDEKKAETTEDLPPCSRASHYS